MHLPQNRRRSAHKFQNKKNPPVPYHPHDFLADFLLAPSRLTTPFPPSPVVPFTPTALAQVLGVHDGFKEYLDPVKNDVRCDQAFAMIVSLVESTDEACSVFMTSFCHSYLPSFITAFVTTFRSSRNLHTNPYTLLFDRLLGQPLLGRWFRQDPTSRSVEFLVSIFGALDDWFPSGEMFTFEKWEIGVEQRDALDTIRFLSSLAIRLLFYHQDVSSIEAASTPSVTELSLLREFGGQLDEVHGAVAALNPTDFAFSTTMNETKKETEVFRSLFFAALNLDRPEKIERDAFWKEALEGLGDKFWFQCQLPGCTRDWWTDDEGLAELRVCAKCLAVRY